MQKCWRSIFVIVQTFKPRPWILSLWYLNALAFSQAEYTDVWTSSLRLNVLHRFFNSLSSIVIFSVMFPPYFHACFLYILYRLMHVNVSFFLVLRGGRHLRAFRCFRGRIPSGIISPVIFSVLFCCVIFGILLSFFVSLWLLFGPCWIVWRGILQLVSFWLMLNSCISNRLLLQIILVRVIFAIINVIC